MALARITKFFDFQAEYEGSLYFTRSNVFRVLVGAEDFVPTNSDAPFQGAGATSSSNICYQSGEGEFNYQLHSAAWFDDSRQATFAEPIEWSVSGFR